MCIEDSPILKPVARKFSMVYLNKERGMSESKEIAEKHVFFGDINSYDQ